MRKWSPPLSCHPVLRFLISLIISLFQAYFDCCGFDSSAVAQDVQDQEEARKEDEAEQADLPLDPHEDGQHDQGKSPPLIFTEENHLFCLTPKKNHPLISFRPLLRKFCSYHFFKLHSG
ncbi:hypothetical protein SAY87_029254 [Trapa incisa]|uniref:Secreted protein n=1 Tax=Trapa incisa TaxID=236973 RepID=A0AAN7L3H0_9MYRT|nr:hypothetical protein SAY87_029254 [Trapa incisa]